MDQQFFFYVTVHSHYGQRTGQLYWLTGWLAGRLFELVLIYFRSALPGSRWLHSTVVWELVAAL